MIHCSAVPEERIPVEFFPRSASMVTLAFWGQEVVWDLYPELYDDLEPFDAFVKYQSRLLEDNANGLSSHLFFQVVSGPTSRPA
jgi:hypothetical protein